MRVAVIGHGRMGREVEAALLERGHEPVIVARAAGFPHLCPVGIDFTQPDAVVANTRRALEAGARYVVGTTGWGDAEPEVRELVAASRGGLVHAANFSLGVNLFYQVVRQAAALIAHFHPAYFLECLRIPKPQVGRPIAHDQVTAVAGQAPAFPGIAERSLQRKRGPVVDESDARRPGKLDQFSSGHGDPFPEVLPFQADFLHDFAGFQADFADYRVPFHAGAFVKTPVVEDQPLRECGWIMRVGMDHAVGVRRSLGRGA